MDRPDGVGEDTTMKKMLVLAMTMALVLLAAAGVCETLRVGMECNYAPYNWTQSDASENAVAMRTVTMCASRRSSPISSAWIWKSSRPSGTA